MARSGKQRPAESVVDGDAAIDHGALIQAAAAHDEQTQMLALIAVRYDVGMAYDYERYVTAGRQLVVETSLRMFELGKILLQLRERENKVQFQAALERMNIGTRFAYRAIQSAIKFQGSDQHVALANRLGSAKLLELLAEDDADIAELANGGTLAGLTPDEIDSMSSRELRAALRAERHDRADEKAADEEIIAKKDERINKLMRDKRTVARSGTRAQVADLLAELDQAAIDVASNLKQLRDATSAIRAAYDEAGEAIDEDVVERIEQNLQWAAASLRQVAEELGE